MFCDKIPCGSGTTIDVEESIQKKENMMNKNQKLNQVGIINTDGYEKVNRVYFRGGCPTLCANTDPIKVIKKRNDETWTHEHKLCAKDTEMFSENVTNTGSAKQNYGM